MVEVRSLAIFFRLGSEAVQQNEALCNTGELRRPLQIA
jgi:hypothetical protein